MYEGYEKKEKKIKAIARFILRADASASIGGRNVSRIFFRAGEKAKHRTQHKSFDSVRRYNEEFFYDRQNAADMCVGYSPENKIIFVQCARNCRDGDRTQL